MHGRATPRTFTATRTVKTRGGGRWLQIFFSRIMQSEPPATAGGSDRAPDLTRELFRNERRAEAEQSPVGLKLDLAYVREVAGRVRADAVAGRVAFVVAVE